VAMPYLLVRHKVADYAKWKPVFDEHGATRQASGSKGGLVLRSADDPTEVILLLEWDDLEKARQFAGSADLREAMQRAGVSDHPDLYFLDQAERVTA
jgi:heme-degrading monooxygenase HmoA